MINKVGRNIPDEIIENNKIFQGYADRNQIFKKTNRALKQRQETKINKLVDSIEKVIKLCGLKNGDTISFHHHFREGDYVVKMVVDIIAKMGFKNITIAATSLGTAQDELVKYFDSGVITGLQTSGIRGKVGEAVSNGLLKTPVILRSHGGRVRAVSEGEVHINIAFIGASSSDEYGNARGKGGKSNCGVLSYANVDSKYAENVVIITDTIVEYPNFPPSIQSTDVDFVVKVDSIGDPSKIASSVTRITQDPKELLMAKTCLKVMESMPYYKEGFSFQTGAGGPTLAVNTFLEDSMTKRGIKMGWAIGGISKPMVDLLEKDLVGTVVNAQSFDLAAVDSVNSTPNHFEITTSQYASPSNKGAFVDKLDFAILAALEVDINFNVNVITGSDGILRGAPGGHPDAAHGAKCTIVVSPLVRGRMATLCDEVVTVTTPGDDIDIVITDYGISVNPKRSDIMENLNEAGIKYISIESQRDYAYKILGTPDPLQWEDKVVAIVQARDGSVLDIVKQIKK